MSLTISISANKIFEKIKEKNITSYNTLSREYNNLYLGKVSEFQKDNIDEFDENIFDGKLINECGIIQIIEHGSYDDIDELKHNFDLFPETYKNGKKILSPIGIKKSHTPLPVPVIFISGKIGYSSYMMPDEQIEDSVPIIDQLKYNSLLTSINQKKQIQKVAHNLRLLHKHYLQVQIDEITEINKQETNQEIIDSNKLSIKLLKKEMKMIYDFFNPYNFKKGSTINKYLTFMEGKNAPEYGRTRGIFDINGSDYFESYVNENKSLKGVMDDSVRYTIINLGDLIHYMYLKMDRIPKYFIIIDHSCSGLGIELRETLNQTNQGQNKYAKNFYNKHLNVQKRSFSFNKTRKIKRSGSSKHSI